MTILAENDIGTIFEAKSLLPSVQYMNNTKVINTLVEDNKLNDYYEVNVFKNVYTTVDLVHDENVTLSRNITAFDKMIMDCVYSLLVSGNKVFTIDMVYRVFCGKITDNINISESEREKIKESINYLRHVDVTIRCEQEMKNRKIEKVEFTGYALPLEKVVVKLKNGVIKEGYIANIDTMPIFYKYASASGQIVSVPSTLIGLNRNKKEYAFDIKLKRYLIQRIENMKRNNNLVSEISYFWEDKEGNKHGLCNYLDIELEKNEKGKKQKQRLDKNIIELLDAFVKANYIKGYSPVKKNRAIVKYIITC